MAPPFAGHDKARADNGAGFSVFSLAAAGNYRRISIKAFCLRLCVHSLIRPSVF